MAPERKVQPDPRLLHDPVFEHVDVEVEGEFAAAAGLGGDGPRQLAEKLRAHNSLSPKLSGGDIDAAWEDAAVGEESVGGENPTPDQDIVDEIGDAAGLPYHGGEPLHSTEKLEFRDAHRWELDPASSEDFVERSRDGKPSAGVDG